MSSELVNAVKQKGELSDDNETIVLPTQGNLNSRYVMLIRSHGDDYQPYFEKVFAAYESEMKGNAEHTIAISFDPGYNYESYMSAIRNAIVHLKKDHNSKVKFVLDYYFIPTEFYLAWNKIEDTEKSRLTFALGNIATERADVIVCPVKRNIEYRGTDGNDNKVLQEIEKIYNINQQQKDAPLKATLHSHERHLREWDAKETPVPNQWPTPEELGLIDLLNTGVGTLQDYTTSISGKEWSIELDERAEGAVGILETLSQKNSKQERERLIADFLDVVPDYQTIAQVLPNRRHRQIFIGRIVNRLMVLRETRLTDHIKKIFDDATKEAAKEKEKIKDDWVTLGNISSEEIDIEPIHPFAHRALVILTKLGNTEFKSKREKEATEKAWLEELKMIIPDYERLKEIMPNLSERMQFILQLTSILNDPARKEYAAFHEHVEHFLGKDNKDITPVERLIKIFRDLKTQKFPNQKAKKATEDAWLKEFKQLIPDLKKCFELLPTTERRDLLSQFYTNTLPDSFEEHIQEINLEFENTHQKLLEKMESLPKKTFVKDIDETLEEIRATLPNRAKIARLIKDPEKFIRNLETEYFALANKQVIHGAVRESNIPGDLVKARSEAWETVNKDKLAEKDLETLERLLTTHRNVMVLFPEKQFNRDPFVTRLSYHARRGNAHRLRRLIDNFDKEKIKLYKNQDFENYLRNLRKSDDYDQSLDRLSQKRMEEGSFKRPKHGLPETEDI